MGFILFEAAERETAFLTLPHKGLYCAPTGAFLSFPPLKRCGYPERVFMTIAITKLTGGWCSRARGGVQDVDTFRVAQGRIVLFFGKDAGTKLEIT